MYVYTVLLANALLHASILEFLDPFFTATVGEDYLAVDMNITFTSGQNASGDNQQCFFVPILNDDLLECNETFDVVITSVADDDDVINVTGHVITVTIEEDANDCMLFVLTKFNAFQFLGWKCLSMQAHWMGYP